MIHLNFSDKESDTPVNIIKAWASITNLSTLLFSFVPSPPHTLPSPPLRLGKHRRDERPEGRMERKGSSKSKAEKKQAPEQEESPRLKLEQER